MYRWISGSRPGCLSPEPNASASLIGLRLARTPFRAVARQWAIWLRLISPVSRTIEDSRFVGIAKAQSPSGREADEARPGALRAHFSSRVNRGVDARQFSLDQYAGVAASGSRDLFIELRGLPSEARLRSLCCALRCPTSWPVCRARPRRRVVGRMQQAEMHRLVLDRGIALDRHAHLANPQRRLPHRARRRVSTQCRARRKGAARPAEAIAVRPPGRTCAAASDAAHLRASPVMPTWFNSRASRVRRDASKSSHGSARSVVSLRLTLSMV